jgi:hypothetical protein
VSKIKCRFAVLFLQNVRELHHSSGEVFSVCGVMGGPVRGRLFVV